MLIICLTKAYTLILFCSYTKLSNVALLTTCRDGHVLLHQKLNGAAEWIMNQQLVCENMLSIVCQEFGHHIM